MQTDLPRMFLHPYTLTHCILVDSTTFICCLSPFVIWGCWVYFVALILLLMEILSADNIDADKMQHYVASDQGLHGLPMSYRKNSMYWDR